MSLDNRTIPLVRTLPDFEILEVKGVTNFTPVLSFGGASVGITYSTQAGFYSKINGIIFIGVTLILTSKGSSTGDALISIPELGAAASVLFPCSVVSNNVTISNALKAQIVPNTGIRLVNEISGGSVAVLSNAELANNSTIRLAGFYFL